MRPKKIFISACISNKWQSGSAVTTYYHSPYSDDAAGLAISTSLRTTSKVYAQGIRNLNDGLSAVNIAESAMS